MMRAFRYWASSILLVFVAGCREGPLPPEEKAAPPVTHAAQNAAGKASTAPAKVAAQTVGPAKPSAAGVATADTKPGMVREQAHVGMGVKGHGYGGSYIAVVAASYWSTKERLGLMQIQHDMDLFKANNDGKGPKTHEEFMQKIIKEGAIKLPELPPGQKYLYDPATETLMVLKPPDPNGP